MSLDTVPESRGDALDSLWRFASSGRVTLALIALLAATLALALIFPQLPAGLDSAATDRWFSAAVAGYRSLGTMLRAIGAFDILQGLWLRVLLAFLAYNLALRLADQLRRIRQAWRTVALPPPFPPDLPAAARDPRRHAGGGDGHRARGDASPLSHAHLGGRCRAIASLWPPPASRSACRARAFARPAAPADGPGGQRPRRLALGRYRARSQQQRWHIGGRRAAAPARQYRGGRPRHQVKRHHDPIGWSPGTADCRLHAAGSLRQPVDRATCDRPGAASTCTHGRSPSAPAISRR